VRARVLCVCVPDQPHKCGTALNVAKAYGSGWHGEQVWQCDRWCCVRAADWGVAIKHSESFSMTKGSHSYRQINTLNTLEIKPVISFLKI